VIAYRTGNKLDVDAVIELYKSCSLGARRPSDDRGRMAAMLANANLVITAWDEDLLVGISRSLSDFAYATYLSDLAVRESYQKRGIGRELIRLTQAAGGPETTVILLAAPAAVNYYPRIGFTRHDSAWIVKGSEPLQP
jgi:predicted N-acetyltransferase YhbS